MQLNMYRVRRNHEPIINGRPIGTGMNPLGSRMGPQGTAARMGTGARGSAMGVGMMTVNQFVEH